MNVFRSCCYIVLMIALALTLLPDEGTAATQGPLLGTWEEVTTSGTYTPRSRAASAFANNYLWVIGGVDANGSVVNTVEGLYVLTRAWTTKAPMPTARRDAAAVAVDGKIYVLGGADANGDSLKTVEMFDPATNTWTAKADMPVARAAIVAVPYTRGTTKEIHVYGSDPGAVFPDNVRYDIYDIATDQWRPGPVTAPSAQCEACGTAAKDLKDGQVYLYLFGGYSGGAGVSPSCWRIDPSQASPRWDSEVGEMPRAVIQAAAITVDAASPDGGTGQYPFVIGGNTDRSGTNFSSAVMVYESGIYNGWITGPDVAPNLPEPRGNRPGVCIAGGKLWVVGGATVVDGAVVPATKVFRATINTNNYPPPPPVENPLLVGWENVNADIPTPRWYTVHAVVDGKLYVIGGWDTNDGYGAPPVGVNEMYDPATNTWYTKAPMPVPVRGAACAAIGKKIYVAGGSRTKRDVPDYCDVLQIYDTTTDSWTIGPPMPTPRDLVTGFAVEGKFHVIGGSKDNPANPGQLVNAWEHEVYDPEINAWYSANPPGTPWPLADSSATVVASGDYQWVYMANGWWSGTQLSYAARWNGVTGGPYSDQWYRIADLPVGGNSGATLTTITDATGTQWPAIFGGHFGPIGYFNKVFVYHEFGDPLFSNRWMRDTALPYPRGGRMAVAQIGNYVYVAAGMGPLGLARDTWRSAVGSGLPTDVERIGEAISQPNGKRVNFTQPKIVTRTYTSQVSFETYFWIEEEDRSAALRVGPTTEPVYPGNKVLVAGRITTDEATGERTLSPSSITVDSNVYDIPKAIGITNRSFIGGSSGSQPGRPDGIGLNNMGMLARVWGKVTRASTGDLGFDYRPYFYIDDGSGLSDGTQTNGVPNVGLRVYHQYYVNPPEGAYVSVTGIVSCERIDGKLVPMLLSDELTITTSDAIRVYEQ